MNDPNSGTNGYYEDALEKSPFGFAYHEIITDDQGEPMDYKFLEVNRAFEKLTALKESEITGERATEVFPNLTESEFGWVKQYREVALADGEFEQVVSRLKEELEKWNEENGLLDFPVTLSMGSAHCSPDQDRDVEDALEEADKKMYQAKER